MVATSVSASVPQRIDCLEGIRALAAVGVLITHVHFQTASGPVVLERFDYFVAVFFALSAFLLWRRPIGPGFLRKRAARVLPAYLVCVAVVALALPAASTMSWQQLLANLTATQIYIPDGLAPGLTHLWSLCVEFAFYFTLPLIAWVLLRWQARTRVLALCVVGIASLGWAFLPFVAGFDGSDGASWAVSVNRQIWPPAYTLWFVVGMLAAEAESADIAKRPGVVRRILGMKPLFWALATACLFLASWEAISPRGLTHPSPLEFAIHISLGTVFAACIVVPYALRPTQSGLLLSQPVQAVGRWSYSLFLWHVAVLSIAFPLAGIEMFSGGFVIILTLTLGLSVAVAAISYTLVEEPARLWLRQATAPAAKHAASKLSPA